MKVKIFEIILHKLPSGKSPATALEERLNEFLAQHSDLRLVTSHMSTLVAPAEPNAMPRSEESSIVIFCTLFYIDGLNSDTQPNIVESADTKEAPVRNPNGIMLAYEQSMSGKPSGAS
jgi:hypothetical protein